MSSKTKIIVLHMKEVVYTAVFLALALILLVVFLIMFSGKKDSAKKPSVTTAASAENARYIPGIYTSTISLGNQTFDVQVNVEQDRITAISLNNLSETTAAMYQGHPPLFSGNRGNRNCRMPEGHEALDENHDLPQQCGKKPSSWSDETGRLLRFDGRPCDAWKAAEGMRSGYTESCPPVRKSACRGAAGACKAG